MITKTANRFVNALKASLGKIPGSVKATVGLGYGVGSAAGTLADGVLKASKGAYGVARPGVRAAGKGLGAAYKKAPGTTLAGLGLTGLAGLRLRDRLQRNLVHSDPNLDLTRQNLWSIDYKSPAAERQADRIYGRNFLR